MANKIPVILDTDIGGDIDDSWALALLLSSPELDVKMILISTGDTMYRAKIVAKMLQIGGRTDIPIGLGIKTENQDKPLELWIKDFSLAAYPGEVYKDGISAAISIVMKSVEPITFICIAPLTSMSELLRKEPTIVNNAVIIGMHGSLKQGVEVSQGPIAEWNIVQDITAAQNVFSASWPVALTPLDTCGLVKLEGELYQYVRNSANPFTSAVMESYEIWDRVNNKNKFSCCSSVLFDTVAVYMAFSTKFLRIKELSLRVDNDGFTRICDKSKRINCAVE